MGQRSSIGSSTAPTRRTGSTPQSSPALSQESTPKHTGSASSSCGASTKAKKPLKTFVKDTAVKRTLPSRSRLGSDSPATKSPASLHGRVLHKTASVSPAPSKPLSASQPSHLTRFGFKNGPLITSGDSTDSVNSILSDAQTASDVASNGFDLADEPSNAPTVLLNNSRLHTDAREDGNNRAISPCTISQASSGVTSSLINGKLKAQAKQLPVPQVVTVKAMSNAKKKTSPSNTVKSRYGSPTTRSETPPRSPLTSQKLTQRSKLYQNTTKSSLPRPQRTSRDSESSGKSLNTFDSGLGSSTESDKLRSPASLLLRSAELRKDEKGKEFDLDVSDAWLKEKQVVVGDKNKSEHLNLKFKEEPENQSSLVNSLPEKQSQKDSFKEKRDSNITYGMARQKFAPYNRNRLLYQNTKEKPFQTVVNTSKQTQYTNIKFTNRGTVRNRIAQIEKTPFLPSKGAVTAQKVPKKPTARPTTIEKTPILVNSKKENLVELSKPMCRRLEYNEGKSTLLETQKDNKKENNSLTELQNTAQDLLMVDSVEVKKENINVSLNEYSLSSSDNMSVNIANKKSFDESPETKRIKDITECENSTKRLSEVPSEKDSENYVNNLHLPLSESSGKVFSPDGSETSFEVLDSGSADNSPKDENLKEESNGYVSQLISGLAPPVDSVSSPSTKHSRSSPSKTASKKCRQDTDIEKNSPRAQIDSATKSVSLQSSQTSTSKSVMESSMESSRMSDSMDRWTVSGKCTPTLSSTRGDDQDFLIDDEISDQPGLTFGDDLDNSFLGDEDLFSDEISSHSATNILPKNERSRHGSLGTASSVGPEDLMLDFDIEDQKPSGGSLTPQSIEAASKSSDREQKVKSKKPLQLSISGPRYVEEVLSPIACDILSEWSAILSDTQSSSRVASPSCISQPTVGVSNSTSSPLNVGICPSQTVDISTHQPQSTNKEYSAVKQNRSSSFSPRSRTSSADNEYCTSDVRKEVHFKPPRQSGPTEQEGGINIDRTSLHYIFQDVTTMKTLLLRLRRVLQVADTINPFDANLKTSLYLSLGANDASSEREEPAPNNQDVVQQNVDLKRQVVLLQQRLDEKDRAIRILQNQLSQALVHSTSSSGSEDSTEPCMAILKHTSTPPSVGESGSPPSCRTDVSNAATQTERPSHRASPFNLASMSRTSSIEDGLGPTVSSEAANISSLLALADCDLSTAFDSQTKNEASPKKKYPSEFLVVPSAKLSLAPSSSPVAESLAS